MFVSAVGGVLPAKADGATLCADGKQLAVELLLDHVDVICLALGAVR